MVHLWDITAKTARDHLIAVMSNLKEHLTGFQCDSSHGLSGLCSVAVSNALILLLSL